MNTFWKRTLTATVFMMVVLTAVLWNVYSYFALFLFITVGCLWEYYTLIQQWTREGQGTSFIRPLSLVLSHILVGCIIFLLSIFISLDFIAALWYILVLPLLLLIYISRFFFQSSNPFSKARMEVLGLIYIAVPLSLLNFIVINDTVYFWHKLLGILLLVWTNDTMAYIVGSLIGRNKLFERISPKKTWEGTIGGIICCILVGWILSKYFPEWTKTDWLVIAGIVGVFGTIGDLVESALKRRAGVKDSGTIMPGHGGFLDRFDAFIFSLPFIFAYLKLAGFFFR